MIKILQFSATPDGCYYDLKKWNESNYKIVIGEIDIKYTSSIDIYNENRVGNFCCLNFLYFLPSDPK